MPFLSVCILLIPPPIVVIKPTLTQVVRIMEIYNAMDSGWVLQ